MRYILSLAGLFFCIGCATQTTTKDHQTNYKIEMKLMKDQTVISQPRIIALSGQEAEIEQKSDNGYTQIFVTPSEGTLDGVHGILMKVKINHREGERIYKSKSTMLSKDGGVAYLDLINDANTKDLRLEIKAIRQ